MLRLNYSCIGAAKVAKATLSSSVKSKEGKDMNIQTITHGFMYLIVHLQKCDFRVHLCKLANLQEKKNFNLLINSRQ